MNEEKKDSKCLCIASSMAFGYTCNHCLINSNPFYYQNKDGYHEKKEIALKNIGQKNKSLGKCNCIFFFDSLIYDCNNCHNDLSLWDYHFRSDHR